ncbi:hypothetical protein [Myroides fluvii]|uniref:hypothetical protein n=1 Tax=Myroides fluvii TaxID=2572594 RepID=UPI00131D3706|nr:hypothetical protein [Myroides fluvii]
MKKRLWITMVLTTGLSWAQVGINTPNASSTLTVNGSFSGKYHEISGTSPYDINDDDYTLTYTGATGDGTFVLPTTAKMNDLATGRTYQIKNMSPTKKLTVKTQSGQGFRAGNAYGTSVGSQELLPGEYMSIVSNHNGSWDIISWDRIRRASKATLWEGNIEVNSEIRIGDFCVRAVDLFSSKGNPFKDLAYLQFKYDVNRPNIASIWFSKQGLSSPTVTTTIYRTKELSSRSWNYMYRDDGNGYDYLRLSKNEMGVIIIALEATAEMYRITAIGLPDNSSYNVKKQINIIIEKLN